MDIASLLMAPLEPGKRAALHAGNQAFPNDLPPVDSMIAAWLRNFIKTAPFTAASNKVGANIAGHVKIADPEFKAAWQGHMRNMFSRPDVSSIYHALTHDFIKQPLADEMLSEALADVDRWNKIDKLFREQLDTTQVNALYLRDKFPKDEWKRLLKRAGGFSDATIAHYEDLLQVWPTIGDLIQWQRREALNVPLSQALHHYDEMPGSLDKYLKAAGLGWDMGQQVIADGGARTLTPGLAHWAAHWTPLSPSQAYLMYQRLRPERMPKYRDQFPAIQPFTLDDLHRWLRVNEYPKGVRDALAAVAYNTVGVRVIRSALTYHLKDADWATAAFQDQGLHPDDARTSAELMVKQRDQAEQLKLEHEQAIKDRPILQEAAKLARRALRLYRLGAITAAQARGPMSDAGWPEQQMDAAIREADWAVLEELTRSQLSRVRRDYWAGAINADTVRERLAAIGIREARADQYVSSWSLELTTARRASSAGAIQRYYREHLIDRPTAEAQLQVLGWGNTDILLMIAHTDREMEQDAMRLAQTQSRQTMAAAKEIQRSIRAGQSAIKARQTELGRLTPPARMLKWLQDGVVSADWYAARMAALGYSADRITLEIEDAAAGRRKKKSPAVSDATSIGTPGTNGAAQPLASPDTSGGDASAMDASPP